MVLDARVDPEHVAFLQGAFGGHQRKGDVAVGGVRPLGPSGRHDLPDGIDGVGGGAQFEHPPQQQPGQVGLAYARSEGALHVIHGQFVEVLGPTQARELVGGLDDPGGTEDPTGVDERGRVQSPRDRRVHGSADVVDGHAVGPGAQQLAQDLDRRRRPVVGLRVEGRMDAVVGELRRCSLRMGGEQVRLRRARHHQGGGALVGGSTGVTGYHGGTGRVLDRAAAVEEERGHPTTRHLRLQPGVPFTAHTGEVGVVRHDPSRSCASRCRCDRDGSLPLRGRLRGDGT